MIEFSNIESKINKENFIVSEIKGKSMYPLINHKTDKVVISKVSRDINLFDIVLYKNNGKYFLHRVIGVKDDILLIRGDNTLDIEYVNKSEIIGILIGIYNKKKYIEINDEMNKKYYNISTKTLNIRRIKHRIKKVIKE